MGTIQHQKAMRGDLVVATRLYSHTLVNMKTKKALTYRCGVVTATDRAGMVKRYALSAYVGAETEHDGSSIWVVPKDRIDVKAAIEGVQARTTDEFESREEITAFLRHYKTSEAAAA